MTLGPSWSAGKSLTGRGSTSFWRQVGGNILRGWTELWFGCVWIRESNTKKAKATCCSESTVFDSSCQFHDPCRSKGRRLKTSFPKLSAPPRMPWSVHWKQHSKHGSSSSFLTKQCSRMSWFCSSELYIENGSAFSIVSGTALVSSEWFKCCFWSAVVLGLVSFDFFIRFPHLLGEGL